MPQLNIFRPDQFWKNDTITVLSLFDGLGGARVAIDNLGIDCLYYASEVEDYPIQIAQKNYPDNIQLGDVRNVNVSELPHIDLLIGGSPCQDLSIAKRGREGLGGKDSSLFYEYVRILEEAKPDYFILENVCSMQEEYREIITSEIGYPPIRINSALVTAQSRKRYYWTNIIGVEQPDDRKIYLKDILEGDGYTERLKAYCVTATYNRACLPDYFNAGQRQLVFNKPVQVLSFNKGGQASRIYNENGKSVTLCGRGGGGGANTGLYQLEDHVRKLTPIECERLQGLPDDYTEGVPKTHRYRMIGNGFTVPVIEHILSYVKRRN